MLRTKIQETNFGTQKINRIYTNILSYDLQNDDCRVRYELRFRNIEDSPAVPDELITSGTWKVPTNILNNWVGANTFLVEKLCENLGYIILKHLEPTEME